MAKSTDGSVFMFIKLDRDTILLAVFSDANFASSADLSSQPGYVIPLTDGKERITSSTAAALSSND